MNKPKVAWTDGTWERRDYPTILDGLVLRYTAGNAEISASRYRVCVDHLSFTSLSRSEIFDVLDRALRQHEHLKSNGKEPMEEAADEQG